ncbi:hypothetical protein AJ78_04393 [Emergomyces pasteurianus Ep9510]|uniref:Uncharacterized protein n=1 Tax=Emergomyces pasteurianus Ep9510 TaxID=1447872 RepID=A0A1J9QHF6_9EURO|nr:hypothetical protein AJ78_04393 [Emergomyces pasteurianus Ep9510]
MGKILSQLIWLGLASAQITKLPLVRDIEDLNSDFAASLPVPQKYTLTPWTEDDIKEGIPDTYEWGQSLYVPQSNFYCKDDFTIYNVTFPDCSKPWLVGHCAKARMDEEATINLLARLPPSARGIISDLLVPTYLEGHTIRSIWSNSAFLCGQFRPADAVKLVATAINQDVRGSLMKEFQQAVAADTCVSDEDAVNDLKKDGSHGWALESGFIISVYLKLVKSSLDTRCMSNQLKLLDPIVNKYWDTPGCPNKAVPELVKYKGILFPNGLGSLEETSPVSGAEPTSIIQWEKTEGVPEYCWSLAQRKRDNGKVYCTADHLTVYNVTYSDCSNQDPWAICRCDDAQHSVKTMTEKFGRVPAGLRSRVRHLIVLENESPGGVQVDPWNIIGIYGDVHDSVYMHESSHCTDHGFSKSEAFQKAKKLDTCWPTDYSKSTDADLFAETGVAYLYDKSGKTLRERGFDPSCLSNGLKALGDHVGSEYAKDSQCFKREPNSRIVHPSEVGAMSAELPSDVAIEFFPWNRIPV